MPSFISRSLCRGHRPSHLVASRYQSRPDLISRLLRERDVARFVVAPPFYGKTMLMLEYAETVFALRGVVWICCTSPCFLRDLDAEAIAAACLASEERPSLVVFDDVPLLDERRRKLFSDLVDTLLAAGCETIAAMTPMCDSFSLLQRDRMRLGARDLLLSDDELASLKTARFSAKADIADGRLNAASASRIAGISFALSDDAKTGFLRASFAEELPANVMVALCGALVLQQGTWDDLATVLDVGADVTECLSIDYPHLGSDADEGTFDAERFSMTEIGLALRGALASVSTKAGCSSKDEIAETWSRLLMEKGRTHRAAECMHSLATANACRKWLIEHFEDLYRASCFLDCMKIIGMVGKRQVLERGKLGVMNAVCAARLGDYELAMREAKQHAFDPKLDEVTKAIAFTIIVRYGQGSLVDNALAMLAAMLDSARAVASPAPLWFELAAGCIALQSGPDELESCIEKLIESKGDDRGLLVLLSWYFEALIYQGNWEDAGVKTGGAIAETYLRQWVSRVPEGTIDGFTVQAALAYERAHARGVLESAQPLPTSVMFELRRVELSVSAQKHEWNRLCIAKRNRRAERIPARPDDFLIGGVHAPESTSRGVPLLEVRLFGKVYVTIGDKVVDFARFRRKSIKTLLVLLVVNHGRELHVETLARVLWPRSESGVARRNLSSALSQLRKALALDDGSCPYIVKRVSSCSIEERYLRCDVARLEEICRELIYGSPDAVSWTEICKEIERDFGDELAPAERGCELVDEARDRYRNRLVDALVTASLRAIDQANPQVGVWFARAALGHERTREDAYIALMRAQIACNQRTAAMATFLRCRSVLADELGVDPAPEASRLYESLLDWEGEGTGRGMDKGL